MLITQGDYFKLFDGSASNTSCGFDGTPVNALKLSKCLLTPFLQDVINVCMCVGSFPNTLEITEVRPIFTSGDRKIRRNHRPITMLTHM